MAPILSLLRANLGFFGGPLPEALETYLTSLIQVATDKLRDHCHLSLDEAVLADQMLIADYAAWLYRKRVEGPALPPRLRMEIRDRQTAQVKEAAPDAL